MDSAFGRKMLASPATSKKRAREGSKLLVARVRPHNDERPKHIAVNPRVQHSTNDIKYDLSELTT